MGDSAEIEVPSVVTDDNTGIHLRRIEVRRLKKERARAADRRRNFELGETTGFLYFVGMLSIAVAASGELNLGSLSIPERIIVAALSIAALGCKTYIKRRFWQKTLDADWKEQK